MFTAISFLETSLSLSIGLILCVIYIAIETAKLTFTSVGILVGFAFVEPRDLQSHVAALVDQYDISLPDLSRVEIEWTRLRSNIPELWKFNNDGREFQVGESIKARGLAAKYPVVLIPGIVSTVSRYCSA